MRHFAHLGKIIVLDTLGVLLIIAAGLFGWIPGPGGVPLFLAGLALLSINHPWAARLLQRAKNGGSKIMTLLFPQTGLLPYMYDLGGVLLLAVALYVLNAYTQNLVRSAAFIVLFVSLGILVSNRQRLQWLIQHLKRKKH